MKRIIIGLTTGLLASALISTVVWAQATAQISGTVRDQTGAVLPGVEISATQTDTGITRSTVTNETGSYVLPNLAIGPYRLEATLPGFRTFVQSGIVLQVNSTPVINPVLEVGAVTEQVEVQANAALVETRSSGVGQVIENERILELPLNGRNVTELITLAGAAVSRGGEGIGGRNMDGSPRLNISGGMIYGVGFSLDGADYSNSMSISGLPMPFPDALQEFKVETSGVTVQTAKGSGVSAVTKSGTNEFHGSLFEFLRNDLFNAQRYFPPKKSTLKRNQFGGTLGGPIMRNKLFFFGGYQGTTIRQDTAQEAFVPTARMLAGDWTAFASPACNNGIQFNLRGGFVNNRIDPARYSPAAVNIMNRVRALSPQPLDECGSVRYSRPDKQNHHQVIGRIDYQWSDQHSVFGRYTAYQFYQEVPFALTPNNVLNSNAEGNDNLVQSFAFGDTYLIGSNTVNAFRFSANRVFNRQLGPNDAPNSKFWSSCEVGIKMYCGDTPGRSYLQISGAFILGTLHDSQDAVWINAFQVNDDVSLVRGTHQFALGGSLGLSYNATRDRWYGTGQPRIFGAVTGRGLSDFMLGFANSYGDAGPHHFLVRGWTPVLYATDTWKATRNWTVTYGVRWEPFLPWISARGQVANFSVERFRQGIKSTVFPNAPAGGYYPGDPGFPGKSGANNRWWQFGPRLGLAWDVSGDGRTSVRASYSYAYTQVGAHWYETPSMSAPWANANAIAGVSLDDPWATIPGGNPFPYVKGTFSPYVEFYSTPYDLETLQSSSWNLSVQRQIATDWLVSAAYLGNQNTHLWYNQALNPAIYFPGVADASGRCFAQGYTLTTRPGAICTDLRGANTNQRRILNLEKPQGQIGNVAEVDDNGTGQYHGLLLTVQRRAGRGVTINGNYTWSHCINDGVYEGHGGLNNANNVSYNDPNNRSFDRGNCDSDRRHIFNMTAVAETPQFSSPALRALATGWRLAGIYRRSSGARLNILAGSDLALNGIRGVGNEVLQRGNQRLANPYGDKSGRPFTSWLNRGAFDFPAAGGPLGNVGRNSVAGPQEWAFDLALSRVFRFREAQRLEFRAEAFNVTNSFRPGIPNAGLNTAQFGQIRTSGDPRILQFALKYIF